MHKATIIGALLVALGPGAGALPAAAEQPKSEEKKGTTIEDVGRALKSAEQNIEKEIPKIGPAIVDTFKKATGKTSSKSSDDKSKSDK